MAFDDSLANGIVLSSHHYDESGVKAVDSHGAVTILDLHHSRTVYLQSLRADKICEPLHCYFNHNQECCGKTNCPAGETGFIHSESRILHKWWCCTISPINRSHRWSHGAPCDAVLLYKLFYRHAVPLSTIQSLQTKNALYIMFFAFFMWSQSQVCLHSLISNILKLPTKICGVVRNWIINLCLTQCSRIPLSTWGRLCRISRFNWTRIFDFYFFVISTFKRSPPFPLSFHCSVLLRHNIIIIFHRRAPQCAFSLHTLGHTVRCFLSFSLALVQLSAPFTLSFMTSSLGGSRFHFSVFRSASWPLPQLFAALMRMFVPASGLQTRKASEFSLRVLQIYKARLVYTPYLCFFSAGP